MNNNPNSEIIPKQELNLYAYWKVLLKRKKVFTGIFLIPLVIITAISMLEPRYYRGESAIINPVLPPLGISSLMGELDAKKVEIFTNTPDAIKSVSMSLSKKSKDINIIIETKTAEVIPRAFLDLEKYIRNFDEIKEETEKINKQADFQLETLVKAKKANLIFLNRIMDIIKNQREIVHIGVNPADLIKKDADLSVEIAKLQLEKVTKRGSLGPISITKLPTNSYTINRIICVGILSLFASIFVVFFLLDYIDRMKAREKDIGDNGRRT
jgi:hypothetical protein